MKYHGLDIKESRNKGKQEAWHSRTNGHDTAQKRDFSQVRTVTVETNPSMRLTSVVETHIVTHAGTESQHFNLRLFLAMRETDGLFKAKYFCHQPSENVRLFKQLRHLKCLQRQF